ncbi:MAG TPA: alpha-amylase family glycosyl hydrolase, partial [Elusimicrobiota bacterium]|nr:alpha-amylase family glycosyl hydrolase [Elusimicrobiota bacterium]
MSLPSWVGKVIYFAMIDRFQNGDEGNDDQGCGEFAPGDDDCFQGGDLAGLRAKLPYLKRMGFDALWITPPVHNQWINPYIRTRGYHGYWAYDFTKIDPHFGTLGDYKALVADAHSLGLRVIQDIVVNHTGNYFTVSEEGFDPSRPELNWKALPDAVPPLRGVKAPNDPVFRMNNPNVPEHKAAGVYNFTPNISDFRSREQTLTYAMGDLDDVNLKSPLAVERMKEIYRYWIEEVGVDGYRVDTVYYTPEDFYEKFLYDEDPRSPGVKRFAERKGLKDFFVFGEVWSYDYKAIGRYLKSGRAERLDSAIDLPLNEALTRVFYRKAPTESARAALGARRRHHDLWVNFLDNHDVERMSARAGWPAVRQSLYALFTLPGIPCVYYGTEAGLTAARGTMFDEKRFDENSRASRLLRKLIRFRKKHPALAAGRAAVERTSFSAGILSYSVARGEDSYRVVFNTAPDRMAYPLGADEGRLEPLLSSAPLDRRGGALILPPESAYVFKTGAGTKREKPAAPSGARLLPMAAGVLRDEIPLRFRPPARGRAADLFMVCDGDYDRKIRVPDAASGEFRLSAREFGNGPHRLALLARARTGALEFCGESDITVRNPYRLIASADVPADAKGGPGGAILPPAEASYAGQLSMLRVRALTSGRDLRLELSMANVTSGWNPPHGYDHVYFHVFFGFPGQRGKKFLPKLNLADAAFEFNAGFLLYGWGSRSFAAKDSTPDAYGSPLIGEVEQAADVRRKTVAFTFSDRLFDSLRTLAGAKVLITTWDGYLGDLRDL